MALFQVLGRRGCDVAGESAVFAVAALVALTAAAAWTAPCRAALDIEAAGPAERAASTPLALLSGFASPATQRPAALERSAGHAPTRRQYAISAYGFKPFGLPELEFGAIAVALPAGPGSTGIEITLTRLGAPGYSEQVCAITVAFIRGPVSIEPRLRMGVVSAGDALTDWAAVADLEASVRVAPMLRAAVAAENPFALGLAREGSPVPRRIRIGLGVLASSRLGVGFEVSKEPRFPTNIRSGAEYEVARGVTLRSGLQSGPAQVSFGLGIHLRWVTIDVASIQNFDLGTTYEAGITLAWK